METVLKHVEHFHQLQNKGRASEMNKLISDDFYAVFSVANDGTYETYNADEYRKGNIQEEKFYQGKQPHWDYQILGTGKRSDNELIVSTHIDFYLGKELVKKGFCTEVHRKEDGEWKLVRQYMEKYNP